MHSAVSPANPWRRKCGIYTLGFIYGHFLSTGQAAEYLEITVDTLNSRIRAGNFPKPDALIGNRYQGWRQTTIERVRQLQRNQVRHLDIDTTQLVKSINTIRQVAEQTRAAAILATKHLATTGGIDPAAELLLTAARLENLLRATLCENRLGAALSGCKLGQSPKHVSQLQIEPLDIVDPTSRLPSPLWLNAQASWSRSPGTSPSP